MSKKLGLSATKLLALLEHLSVTNLHTSEGQAMDIELRRNDLPTENEYMKAVMKKTAYYLMSPAIGAAIVANLSEEKIKDIVEYGGLVGLAFQIQDDVIDLTAGKGRSGKIGSDIREGKRTLMVCRAAGLATEIERKRLFEVLNKPREATTSADIVWVKSLYKKYGCVTYARRVQRDLIMRAKAVAERMRPELRELLWDFSDYVVARAR